MELKYTAKFYWGAALIILSFIVGTATKLLFLIMLEDIFMRNLMVGLYAVSWPMLFWGAWWMGKEYADSLRKYFRYKYYHKYVQTGTKKAYHATKTKAKDVQTKTKNKAKNIQTKARAKSNQIKEKVKKKIKHHQNNY
jgi:hypothetical protein